MTDTTFTAPPLPIRARWQAFVARLASAIAPARETGDTPEATAARRADLHAILDRCPGAFPSQEDVQAILHLYPGRF